MANKEKELRDLRISDFILLLWIIVSITGLYSNNLDRKSIIYENKKNTKEAHTLRIIIFTISLLVYMYFVNKTYKQTKQVNKNITEKQIFSNNLRLLANIIFFVGGLLFLFLEIEFNDVDVAIE